MTERGSFAEVLGRLRAGDDAAATEVFQRFVHRLIALARSRLDPHLRAKLDPEDVVQSVFRSFFTRHKDGQFTVDGWDGLWALLTLITIRKCRNKADFFYADRRSVVHEVSFTQLADHSDSDLQLFARDPTPSQAAMLAEILERSLRDLDERDREIAVRSLQGYSVCEISEQVGRSERTVRRVLHYVRSRMERLHRDDGE